MSKKCTILRSAAITGHKSPSGAMSARDIALNYDATTVGHVGCIYASKSFNSSLIYYQCLFSLQFHYQTSKTTQIYFFYFSCIFTEIVSVSFVFSMLYVVQRFVPFASILTFCFHLDLLLPSQPFDSGSRKHLPTHWLYPTIWPPDGQGTKEPGK